MKLPASTKSKITKNKYGENVTHSEIIDLTLVQCNTVSNDYQEDSRVLYTLVPNEYFGQLWDILPKNLIIVKTFDS